MAEHKRVAATLTDLLEGEYPPGLVVGDCSCGHEYTVPAGPDEFNLLEASQAAHAASA